MCQGCTGPNAQPTELHPHHIYTLSYPLPGFLLDQYLFFSSKLCFGLKNKQFVGLKNLQIF